MILFFKKYSMPKKSIQKILDDELDIIELIQTCWRHKIKFVTAGLLGLCLGLVFTFQHDPRYSTNFSFTLGHPMFSKDFLLDSSLIQKLLNDSAFNKNVLPRYSLDKRTKIFTIESKKPEVRVDVESLLNEILNNEVEIIKKTAKGFMEYNTSQIIVNLESKKIINYSNADLLKLDNEAIKSSLQISFSKTKSIYPNPFKHGLVGFIIGLAFGFVWMFIAIIKTKINCIRPSAKIK